MKIIEDIDYAGKGSKWNLGNLYIPDNPGPHPLALCIHGGGWAALDRSSTAGVAEFLCANGIATFNIEYRLLGEAPWPACGDDCLAAAQFLLNGDDIPSDIKHDKLFIIGGSAGGHLALMTGMRLPADKVHGIVSFSGIADLETDMKQFPDRYGRFWNHEPQEEDIRNASPLYQIRPGLPPILCTHCPNDNVVDISGPQEFVQKCRKVDVDAEIFEYSRPREAKISHCIWIPDSSPHKLYPEIEESIINFARRLF